MLVFSMVVYVSLNVDIDADIEMLLFTLGWLTFSEFDKLKLFTDRTSARSCVFFSDKGLIFFFLFAFFMATTAFCFFISGDHNLLALFPFITLAIFVTRYSPGFLHSLPYPALAVD